MKLCSLKAYRFLFGDICVSEIFPDGAEQSVICGNFRAVNYVGEIFNTPHEYRCSSGWSQVCAVNSLVTTQTAEKKKDI